MQKFFFLRWCPPIGELYDSIAGGGNQLINTIRKSGNWSFFYKGLFDVPAEHC